MLATQVDFNDASMLGYMSKSRALQSGGSEMHQENGKGVRARAGTGLVLPQEQPPPEEGASPRQTHSEEDNLP